MANTAFGHDATLTTPGSTTDTALVRWANTSGTSLNNTINILSDGSNITLNARGEIRFSDADSSNFIAFESPATVGTSYTMTLPADLPAADEVLTVTSYSGGAGVLEWAAAGGGGAALTGSTSTQLVTVTGSNTIRGEGALVYTEAETTGDLKIDYNAGPAIVTIDGIGKSMIRMLKTGAVKWEVGMDGDGSTGQKSHVDDYAFWNGSYIVVFSGNGSNKGGIGTIAGIALSGAEIPDDGIQFPSTVAASSNANNLDQYEEGVFTPKLTAQGSSNEPTYTRRMGRYTRIGNRVYFHLHILLSGFASLGSGQMIIGDLPFTSANQQDSEAVIGFSHATGFSITAGTYFNGVIGANFDEIYMLHWDATTGSTDLERAQLGTSAKFKCTGFYEV